MHGFATAQLVVPSRRAGDDRACVVHGPDAVVIAVADGAGGTSNGGAAAETVVRAASEAADALSSRAIEPSAFLCELDARARAAGGQTTAVLAIVRAGEVWGASVGDSSAMLHTGDRVDDLTEAQRRKPLLGSGAAKPVAFRARLEGTLLVATDGLWKYASYTLLLEALRHPRVEDIPEQLVSLVRLPAGGLQDDVAIVVCRAR
jgi:serine/threonine protein phosphatase PrpC